MFKIVLLIIIAIVVVATVGWFWPLAGDYSNYPTNYPAGETAVKSAVESAAAPTASQNGVEAAVEQVTRQGGQTIVALSFNNHVYDLSVLDGQTRSNLAGVAPLTYRVLDSATGGHHLRAELTFPGELTGELLVGLGEELTFKFNL